MNFWVSPIEGKEITGSEKDSFCADFTIIPENTTAFALFKECAIVQYKEKNGDESDCYQITWKITNGDFKGREVSQKIKAFDSDNNARFRALNMLARLYVLCALKRAHSNIPSVEDFNVFKDKILGIKIRQWSNEYEGKINEGNYVCEIHATNNFICETGVMKEPEKTSEPARVSNNKAHTADSALSRNSRRPVDNLQDIPF